MNRRLRSQLDLLKPSLHRKMEEKNDIIIHPHARHFEIGERVFVRNYANGPRWIPAIVTKVTGPLSYEVKSEMRDFKCHIDQLQRRMLSKRGIEQKPMNIPSEEEPVNPTPIPFDTEESTAITPTESTTTMPPENPIPNSPIILTETDHLTTMTKPQTPVVEESIKSRLRRNVKPPNYLEQYER